MLYCRFIKGCVSKEKKKKYMKSCVQLNLENIHRIFNTSLSIYHNNTYYKYNNFASNCTNRIKL